MGGADSKEAEAVTVSNADIIWDSSKEAEAVTASNAHDDAEAGAPAAGASSGEPAAVTASNAHDDAEAGAPAAGASSGETVAVTVGNGRGMGARFWGFLGRADAGASAAGASSDEPPAGSPARGLPLHWQRLQQRRSLVLAGGVLAVALVAGALMLAILMSGDGAAAEGDDAADVCEEPNTIPERYMLYYNHLGHEYGDITNAAPEAELCIRVRMLEREADKPWWCWERWDLGEIEWYEDYECTQPIVLYRAPNFTNRVTVSGVRIYNLPNLWDGEIHNNNFLGMRNGDEYWVSGRFVGKSVWFGLRVCDREVKCIKLFQSRANAGCQASTIVVEKQLSSGWWFPVQEQTVANQRWETVVVNTDVVPCQENQHVSNGTCVPCKCGYARSMGDDPRKGDTTCKLKLPSEKFYMGAMLASQLPWTYLPSTGLSPAGMEPMAINVAACRSQLVVTWTSQEQLGWPYGVGWQAEGASFGHVSAFSARDGSLEMTANHRMPACAYMGGVATTPDCSVIAALCMSRHDPWNPDPVIPNHAHDVFEENKAGKLGWAGNCPWEFKFGGWVRDCFNAYLFEWTSGTISPEPDMSARLNTAIGGNWKYGSWSIVVSADASEYGISLKTSIGNHEGGVRFVLRRPDLTLVRNEFACASGHVLWNQQAYNNAQKMVGHWCGTDAAGGDYKVQNAVWFVSPSDTDLVSINGRGPHNSHFYSGHPTDILSRGSEGWIGVFTILTDPEKWESQKIGLVNLPLKNKSDRIARDHRETIFPDSINNFDTNHSLPPSASYPRLARLGSVDEESDRFLLGWARFEAGTGRDSRKPVSYHVAEIDHTGTIKVQHELHNLSTGWTDVSGWTTIPDTGCVVWVSAWSPFMGPLGMSYGNYRNHRLAWDDWMHLTLYCPDDPSRSS